MNLWTETNLKKSIALCLTIWECIVDDSVKVLYSSDNHTRRKTIMSVLSFFFFPSYKSCTHGKTEREILCGKGCHHTRL